MPGPLTVLPPPGPTRTHRYDQGKGVPQDSTEAARLWQLAADQGHADAIKLRAQRNW